MHWSAQDAALPLPALPDALSFLHSLLRHAIPVLDALQCCSALSCSAAVPCRAVLQWTSVAHASQAVCPTCPCGLVPRAALLPARPCHHLTSRPLGPTRRHIRTQWPSRPGRCSTSWRPAPWRASWTRTPAARAPRWVAWLQSAHECGWGALCEQRVCKDYANNCVRCKQ